MLRNCAVLKQYQNLDPSDHKDPRTYVSACNTNQVANILSQPAYKGLITFDIGQRN